MAPIPSTLDSRRKSGTLPFAEFGDQFVVVSLVAVPVNRFAPLMTPQSFAALKNLRMISNSDEVEIWRFPDLLIYEQGVHSCREVVMPHPKVDLHLGNEAVAIETTWLVLARQRRPGQFCYKKLFDGVNQSLAERTQQRK